MQKQIIISRLEKYYLNSDQSNLLETAKDYLSQGLANIGQSYNQLIKNFSCAELPENRVGFVFQLEKSDRSYSVIVSDKCDLISIKKGEIKGNLLFSGSGFNLATGYSSCWSDIHKSKKFLIKYCQENNIDFEGLGSQIEKIIYLEGNDKIKSAVVFKFRFNLGGFEEYSVFVDSLPFAIRNDYRVGHIQSVLDGGDRYSVMDSLV